jgi:hypothetical protein
VTLLVGPTTTQDAARAFVPAPILPIAGLALPEAAVAAAPMLFNPVGALVFAVGVGAFFALGGDEAVSNLTNDAVCAIFGGDGCEPTSGTGVKPGIDKPNGGSRLTMEPKVTGRGPTGLSVIWGGTCTGIGQTGTDLCNGTASAEYHRNSFGGDFQADVDCSGGPFSVAKGGVITGRFTTSGGTVTHTFPDGSKTSWNVERPTRSDGIPRRVCPDGTEVLGISWGESGTDTSIKIVPGNWKSGAPYPEGSMGVRIDTTCQRSDGTRYVVQGDVAVDRSTKAPSCLPGDGPVATEVLAGKPGGPMTPQGRTEIKPDARTNYEQCLTASGATTCSTTVEVDGKPCAVGRGDCINWQDIARTDPSRVKCKWGPYDVPLTSCEPLGQGYWTGYVTPPGMGNKGWTAITPDGQPAPQPDPSTGGEPQPQPQPNPNPNPDNPTVPDPTPDNPWDPAPNPGGETSNCWGQMVSWNPLDWVLTPVKCALTWAFVPRPGAMADALTSVGTVGPGPWVKGFGDLITATSIKASGNCMGPAWNLGATVVTDPTTLYPFAACSDPQATIASVVKIGLTVLAWLSAGVICFRLVGSAFGVNLNGFGGKDDDA